MKILKAAKMFLVDPTGINMLVRALENATNPRVRGQLARLISQLNDENYVPDPVNKTVLLSALRNDPDPDVRWHAAWGLMNYLENPAVKAAFVHTLKNDPDPDVCDVAANGFWSHVPFQIITDVSRLRSM